MGFLAGLKKLGKGAAKFGGLAAAPFTGGASAAILPALSAVGGVLGGGAQGAAAGRRSDAAGQAQLNALNNQAMVSAGQFNLGAPSQRASQVARGDILSSMQDAPLLGDARIDKFAGGGFRPSAFGASSRQAGEELKRQALMALMSGSDKLTPQMSTLMKSGMLERLGGVAGLVGGVAGALRESDILKQPVAKMGTPPSTKTGLTGWQAKTQIPGYSTDELDELERRRGVA